MDKILKEKVRKKIIAEYRNIFLEEKELREALNKVIKDMVYHENVSLSEQDKAAIIEEMIDEFVGFGPIEDIFNDPHVTEIMINGPKKVYVERQGKTELTDVTFDDEQQLMYLIYKMLAPTRRRVDESSPFTDVALKDGSRVNIIIPPLALNGPVVTIRKFLRVFKNIEDLLKIDTLDKRMADFLVASIKAKANIIFSGSTGAGKTTTLGILSSYINKDERIVTIEDTAELQLMQDNVVRLETKTPNLEGKGEVSIRDLFRNSLRMRPQRIILGEIRSGEALDMLQAICSGHSGALSIIHANSPQDVIYRLEAMIITSGLPINLDAIHRQIATAINLIIQLEQLLDGSRKITHITQVNGLKDNRTVLDDLFIFEQESIDAQGKVKGRWHATGILPSFSQIFKKAGIDLPPGLFNKD